MCCTPGGFDEKIIVEYFNIREPGKEGKTDRSLWIIMNYWLLNSSILTVEQFNSSRSFPYSHGF